MPTHVPASGRCDGKGSTILNIKPWAPTSISTIRVPQTTAANNQAHSNLGPVRAEGAHFFGALPNAELNMETPHPPSPSPCIS